MALTDRGRVMVRVRFVHSFAHKVPLVLMPAALDDLVVIGAHSFSLHGRVWLIVAIHVEQTDLLRQHAVVAQQASRCLKNKFH